MNPSPFSLRDLSMLGLLIFGPISFAYADSTVSGKLNRIDLTSHTFTVQWTRIPRQPNQHNMHPVYFKESTFKTTDKTTFLVDGMKGSWSDLKKGVHVNITAHTEGADRVADNVELRSESGFGRLIDSIQESLLGL